MIRWLVLFALLSLPARAEEVIAGLSQNQISISAFFDGSELLIFGAIKREEPADADSELGVIVTVEGPDKTVTVRRKERWGPIWINRRAVEIDAAPSFYAVNTTGPLETILRNVEDLRYSITISRAIRSVGAPMDVMDSLAFSDALIRIRQGDDLYQTNIGAVDLTEETLFDTSVVLPANLVEGIYNSRIFLTRGGVVINSYSTAINVEKVGLERFLYSLAHDDPLIYGFLSLGIAIAAGWGASAAFRYLQS